MIRALTLRSLTTLVALLTLAIPTLTFAQGGVVRLGAIYSDATTFDGDGDEVVLVTNGHYASLRLDINGAMTGTITLSCSVDGTTYDPISLNGPAPASTEDSDGAVTVTGMYTAGVAACRKVRALASGWSAGSPVVTLSATASGGASSGGSSGAVSITQGGNTAAVNASSQLSVTCANCSGTGVSQAEDTAFVDGGAVTPAGTVRQDTIASSTTLDGDVSVIKSDSVGRIYTTGSGGTFPVTDSGGSLTVDGTVTVTDGAGALNAIIDSSALPTGASTAANQTTAITSLQLIDDAAAVLGTATYTEATTTGLVMGAVRRDANTTMVNTTNEVAPLQVDASGSLKVAIISGAGSGGTALADNAAYTPGTTSFTPIGGEVDDTATTAATENSAAAARMTVQRALHVNLRSAAGAEITAATDVTEDAAETAGGTGPMVLNVRRDVLASSAGTTGDNATFNSTSTGALWVAQPDPCSFGTKVYVNINQTTGTQLWTGTASNRSYICSINLVTATAQNIALVSGTGTVCATGIAGIMGGSTAATGWNFAANGGLVAVGGNAAVAKSAANADNVCLLTSSTGQISGNISYVVAP